MIPQTIPNDFIEAFRKHLIRESFNFDWPSLETLRQTLSAWEEFKLGENFLLVKKTVQRVVEAKKDLENAANS